MKSDRYKSPQPWMHRNDPYPATPHTFGHAGPGAPTATLRSVQKQSPQHKEASHFKRKASLKKTQGNRPQVHVQFRRRAPPSIPNMRLSLSPAASLVEAVAAVDAGATVVVAVHASMH